MRERGGNSSGRFSDNRLGAAGRLLPGVSALFILLLLAVTASGGHAQSDATVQRTAQSEETARKAIGLVRSPYCPGLMLEVCPSGEAQLLRDSMHAFAAAGMTADELVEWMVGSHGEEWRAVPKRSGAGLWAWLLPPAVLLFGAGLVVVRLRALHQEPSATAAHPSTISSEDRERIAAALADLDSFAEDEK